MERPVAWVLVGFQHYASKLPGVTLVQFLAACCDCRLNYISSSSSLSPCGLSAFRILAFVMATKTLLSSRRVANAALNSRSATLKTVRSPKGSLCGLVICIYYNIVSEKAILYPLQTISIFTNCNVPADNMHQEDTT